MQRLVLLLAAGLFGVAVAVLPGLANATNPGVTAGPDLSYHPNSVTIAAGGSVDFSNAGGDHNVHFTGPLPTSCSGSEIGPSAAATTPNPPSASSSSWSGSCLFNQPGTYTFECTVHHFTGTVYVNSSGTVPTTTTTPTTTTPTGTVPTPTGGGSQGGGQAVATALRLPAVQRGIAVKGTVTITGAGANLEADLLGSTSQLARSVVVGKTVERGLGAGTVHFKVSLDKRGRAALVRHRRLGLKLVVKVVGSDGASTMLSKSITLRR